MGTISKTINITGNSLMKNQDTSVEITPNELGQIRFFVKNSTEPVIAHVDNLVSTDHCVTIGNKKKDKVMLIEHFMAACAFCGIDSIDVHISNYELPILDGSSLEWVKLFRSAGIKKSKQKFYTVSEPVYYLNGKTSLIVVPDKELYISYSVNYDHPDLNNRWVCFNNKVKEEEIIGARTFGYLKDLKKYQLLGFARGVTYDNTVGLKDVGYTTELRSAYEPAKHKILDLIGDFNLTGFNPLNFKAQIIVKEAGHAVHGIVARELKDKLVEI